MEVGIRQLRAQLAEILDAVDNGDVVVITDRGRPRAQITAVPQESPYEKGIREGWISVGPLFGTTKGDSGPSVGVPSLPGVRLDDVIAADRSDR